MSKKENKDEQWQRNTNWQGVDKDPEEEKKKGEKVSKEDLTGKKVDGDPSLEEDQPINQPGNDSKSKS